MKSLTQWLTALVLLAACYALFSLGFLFTETSRVEHYTSDNIDAALLAVTLESKIVSRDLGFVVEQLGTFNMIADKQLTETNRQIRLARESVDNSLKYTVTGVSDTLAAANNAIGQTTATAHSAQTLLEGARITMINSDIPKLTRDLRQTVAITGVTVSHIRETANTIAERTPAIADSAVKIADSSAGIADDVHKLTSDITRPKHWWQKLYGVFHDASAFGRYL